MKIFILSEDTTPFKKLEDLHNVEKVQGGLIKKVDGLFTLNTGLPDSHIIFSDTTRISSNTVNLLFQNRHNVSQKITSGGVLVCFAGEKKNLKPVNNYSWLSHMGAEPNIEKLSGDEISLLSPNNLPFVGRLVDTHNPFTHEVYFGGEQVGEVILINGAKQVVGIHKKVGTGHVLILPRPRDLSEYAKYFLQNVLPKMELNFETDDGEKNGPPDHIVELDVHGKVELETQIKNQNEKIESEQKTLIELQKKLAELESWKELVWQTGTPLEIVVKKFFKMLGLDLNKSVCDLCDLIGEYAGSKLFVEVKGKEGQIDHKNDFRQILERVAGFDDSQEDEPKERIGVLVGNPYRKLEINQRPPEGESFFAKTSIPISENMGISLVPTTELFRIINDILSGTIVDKELILENIIRNKGIYKYDKGRAKQKP